MEKCFLILALLLFTSTTLSHASNSTQQVKFESCDYGNLDKCAQVFMLFGARMLVLPTSTDEMGAHCAEEKLAVKCIKDWGKNCLKRYPRRLLTVTLKGGANNIRERCRPSETRWYLKSFPCVNNSLPACHDCMDTAKQEMNLIQNNPMKAKWVPSACCLLDKFRSCFTKAIEPHCDEEGKKYMNWVANSYHADITDLACAKGLRDGSRECTELLSRMEAQKSARDISKDSDPKSILVPYYKLLLRLEKRRRRKEQRKTAGVNLTSSDPFAAALEHVQRAGAAWKRYEGGR